MAEKAEWYYVEKNDRKGPVTEGQLKKLIVQGKVSEQTLVWKEGMQDWEKATAINGLIEKPAQTLPQINPVRKPGSRSKVASSPKKGSGVAAASNRTRPADPKASRPPQESTTPASSSNIPSATDPSNNVRSDPGPASPSPNNPTANNPTANHPAFRTGTELDLAATPSETVPAGLENPPAEFGNGIQTNGPSGSQRLGRQRNPNLFEQIQLIGYPCLVIGFLLVISGKGWDSLGNRWASRLNANSQIAEQKFNARYESRINEYQAEIDAITDGNQPNGEQITRLNKQIADLKKEQSQQRSKLSKTTWFDMKVNARMAYANNQSWGFYRELLFVFGSMVLSVGLLVVGITGNPSEKWVCLIMLAIVTFSIYVGGFAWFSSIQGNVTPASLGL